MVNQSAVPTGAIIYLTPRKSSATIVIRPERDREQLHDAGKLRAAACFKVRQVSPLQRRVRSISRCRHRAWTARTRAGLIIGC
jgi:hypothetical protein